MNRNELIDRATLGDILRDFLRTFYGDRLQAVLAQEPEAADDLDKPVEAVWIHEEKQYPGTPSVALLAGSTVWFDYPNSHRVESSDALSEMEDPAEQWVQVWPGPEKRKESKRKLEQYLSDLQASGKERTKLSKQLRYLVADALDAIAETVPVETRVEVAGMTLQVHEVRSNLDSHIFMVCELREEGRPPYIVFEGIKEPGEGWYLHGDLGRYVENAPKELWLKAANHLPEIIEAFKADADKVIAALRRGFEVLRGMLETMAATTDTARLSIEQFAVRLRELEDREGKFVVNAENAGGEVRNPVFASFGPGDLAISVWDCAASLVYAKRGDDGTVIFEPVEVSEKQRPEVDKWLAENVERQGGAINLSGTYRVVLPIPYGVRKALGIA